MELSKEIASNLKDAYRILYLKSREHKVIEVLQDSILEKMVDTLLSEHLSIILQEGNSSEQEGVEACEKIKTLMKQWKVEFDKEYTSKSRWLFWR